MSALTFIVLFLPAFATAFECAAARPARGHAHHLAARSSAAVARSGRVTALDAGLLSDATTLIAQAQLPPEFAELVQPPPPKFSHYLMNAVGLYTIFTAVTTFGPRIAKIARGIDPDALSSSLLAGAPTSNFGWVLAEIRDPLPPLPELTEVRIGHRDEHEIFLCSEDHLLSAAASKRFSRVEVSKDFTDHYGQRVYVCYA